MPNIQYSGKIIFQHKAHRHLHFTVNNNNKKKKLIQHLLWLFVSADAMAKYRHWLVTVTTDSDQFVQFMPEALVSCKD